MKGYALASLFGLLLAAPARPVGGGTYESSESVLVLPLKVDVGLILRTWRIVGVDVCVSDGRPHACLIIENAYPCGLMEVVRKPLTSHLIEVGPIFEPLAKLKPEGLTSSHTTDTGQGTGLQFAEAHIYEWVPPVPLLAQALPIVVPRGAPFAVSYLSEFDAFAWRSSLVDAVLDPAEAAEKAVLPSCSTAPRTGDCAWSWGSWFPRIGFAQHPSEVLHAHLAALRAGRAAYGPPGRFVLARYPFEPRAGHYVQLVRPKLRPSVSIGWPQTRTVEAGALSKEGAYLMIHYGIFRECRGCWGPRLAPARVPEP